MRNMFYLLNLFYFIDLFLFFYYTTYNMFTLLVLFYFVLFNLILFCFIIPRTTCFNLSIVFSDLLCYVDVAAHMFYFINFVLFY